MERLKIEPRPNWTNEVETLGFDFYTMDGVPYWGEDACYRFTAAEVDIIEEAANKLHKLCVYAVQRIVDMRLFPLLGIYPDIAVRGFDRAVELAGAAFPQSRPVQLDPRQPGCAVAQLSRWAAQCGPTARYLRHSDAGGRDHCPIHRGHRPRSRLPREIPADPGSRLGRGPQTVRRSR